MTISNIYRWVALIKRKGRLQLSQNIDYKLSLYCHRCWLLQSNLRFVKVKTILLYNIRNRTYNVNFNAVSVLNKHPFADSQINCAYWYKYKKYPESRHRLWVYREKTASYLVPPRDNPFIRLFLSQIWYVYQIWIESKLVNAVFRRLSNVKYGSACDAFHTRARMWWGTTLDLETQAVCISSYAITIASSSSAVCTAWYPRRLSFTKFILGKCSYSKWI